MKISRMLLPSLCLLASRPVLAEPAWLEGQVNIINAEGQVQPPELAATVRLRDSGASTRTEPNQGYFRLQLPEPVQAAGPLSLEVELPGHQVCVPATVRVQGSGGAPIPAVAVLLVEEGTRSQAECGRRVAVGIAEQVNPHWLQGRKPRPLKPASLMESWARLHDLSGERVQAALELWGRQTLAGRGGSEWERSLVALVTGNHAEAARLAEQVIRQGSARLGRAQQEQSRVHRELVRAYNLQGVAYNASGEYARALEAYEQALRHITRQGEPKLWAAAMSGAGFAHAALAQSEEGAQEHLQSAMHAYRQVLSIYTREKSPREWAALQGNLGVVSLWQAWRLGPEAGGGALDEASEAFVRALEVYTRVQTPWEWTVAQLRLGSALRMRGQKQGGTAGERLLEQAVAVYQTVLENRTWKEMPWEWATAQEGLGDTLVAQGGMAQGKAGLRLSTEAVAAYREALEVYEREEMREEWAALQLKVARTLGPFIAKLSGEEQSRMVEQVAEALTRALTVYTRKQQPQQWAEAKFRLAGVLLLKGKSLVMQAGVQEVWEVTRESLRAVRRALHEALTVYTREEMPKQWAGVQAILCEVLMQQRIYAQDSREAERLGEEERACRGALEGNPILQQAGVGAGRALTAGLALYQQALRAQGAERRRLLGEAEAQLRSAVGGLRLELQPEAWATAQTHLALSLWWLADWADRQEKVRLLEQAASGLREALKVYKPEQHPEEWALVRHSLGNTLAARGQWQGGTSGATLLREACQELDEAFKVYAYEKNPKMWAINQENLAFAFYWLGMHLPREAAVPEFQEAERAYQAALRVYSPERYPRERARTRRSLARTYRELLERAGVSAASPARREPGTPPAARAPPGAGGGWPRLADAEPEPIHSLYGNIYLMDEKGKTREPSTAVAVRIRGYDAELTTSLGSSSFKLQLPETFKAGDVISLSVALEGYEVAEPPGGWLRIPDDSSARPVRILLRPGGQKVGIVRKDALRMKSWLVETYKAVAASTVRQELGVPGLAQGKGWLDVEEGELDTGTEQAMIGMELLYGKDARLAYEAYARGRYEEASTHAERGARERERLLREAEVGGTPGELEQLEKELVRLLLVLGQTARLQGEHDRTIRAFRQVLNHVSRERGAFSWAWSHTELGLTYVLIAEASGGAEAKWLLEHALTHLEAASEVYTLERLPEQWADLQGKRGHALHMLGLREEGEAGARHLREAVDSYRAALEVWEAEEQPLFAAATLHQLGQALTSLSNRVQGGEGVRSLKAAIEHYTQALARLSRHRSPLLWAYIQLSLGQTANLLGSEADEQEQGQWSSEAQAALSQAMGFITREEDPVNWAIAQASLGQGLVLQGVRSEGGERVRLLRQAVEAYQQSLSGLTPEREWTYWVKAELSLGTTLMLLGESLSGLEQTEEAVKVLREGEGVYRQILGATSRGDTPQEWYQAHGGLCVIRQTLEALVPGEQGLRLREGAVGACQQALQGATWMDAPLQARLAESLLLQKKYSESRALLNPLLSTAQVDARTAVRLRVLTIITMLTQGEPGRVRKELEALRALVASQPESFAGEGRERALRALIEREEKLSRWRKWLGELLPVLSARGRTAMLETLDSCGRKFEGEGR